MTLEEPVSQPDTGVEAEPPTPATLQTPELRYIERMRIGVRFCLLIPARSHTVERVTSIRISAKRDIEIYHLAGDERIAVAHRRLSTVPPGVTGVLLQEDGRKPRWQWHVRLAEFSAKHRADPRGSAQEIEGSWKDGFRFRTETTTAQGEVAEGGQGLRPPQVGALHSIGAHWSVFSTEPATVVMPTGTGKTETMLCAVVNYRRGPTLVAVPSDALRWQTARKFENFGKLPELGLVDPDIRNPVVGIITKEPTRSEDLDLLRGCNVVVGVMASLAGAATEPLFPEIAEAVGTLFVDEAHHVASDTWSAFRSHFSRHQIVQFTATPFRLDGKLVDGRVIFSYPLAAAQRDGYFKPIKFVSVFQIDPGKADEEMADEAIAALRADLKAGLNHLLMARCARIQRGEGLLELYRRLAPETNPVLIHSEMTEIEVAQALDALRAGRHRIVVCVNMLGEGFDLPELKVAVLHDLHKSLPVLLQFTGRFTRRSGKRIGNATVVANIADPKVSSKLERLYSESADWNQLLSEASSKAARDHAELIAFLRDSTALVPEENVEGLRISKNLLRPKFSTITYLCDEFTPKTFHEGIPDKTFVHAAWQNDAASLVYFVTRREERVRWTRSKKVADRQWDLFVLFHDEEAGLLHVNSSDKSSLHEGLASAVGATARIDGEKTFRALGGINRLIFSNIGVRKHGRRNMSFAMYTGSDVRQALTLTETTGATKSNLGGRGWEGGTVVSPGCSAKGRVWSKAQGTIPQWLRWCRPIGRKLLDPAINVDKILHNVLIPTEVKTAFPDERVLSVEWPAETLKTSDERIVLCKDGRQVPMAYCQWEHEAEASSSTRLAFRLVSARGEFNDRVELVLDAVRGYRFVGPENIRLRQGRLDVPLPDYLYDYPLVVRYVSLKELEGDLVYQQTSTAPARIEDRQLQPWDWTDVDIHVESTWKEGVERPRSVQSRMATHYVDEGFDIVFNDDDAGEAADLICMQEGDETIRLVLVHCKYSGKPDPGERIKDVVEVSSQAIRSASWRGGFDRLHRHMLTRCKMIGNGSPSRSRFIAGSAASLAQLARASRMKPIAFEILIVQPGVRRSRLTDDQAVVLGSAAAYLRQTVDVELAVVCSA